MGRERGRGNDNGSYGRGDNTENGYEEEEGVIRTWRMQKRIGNVVLDGNKFTRVYQFVETPSVE
jgi:hypothetical protein